MDPLKDRGITSQSVVKFRLGFAPDGWQNLATSGIKATEQEFLDIIPTAEMTPGSLSINAATYVGYKLEGFWGAIVSTLGIVLPSFIAVAIVTALINSHPNDLLIERGLKGLKPAVVVLILSAAVILGEDSLLSVSDFLIFSLVFLLSWQTDINPIVLIVLSGFVGIILSLF